MYNDSMIKRVLEKTISQHENGLLVVDLPTGSGKSYAVNNILFDALCDENNKRKYVFITSAKKNKLYDDLKEMCQDDENLKRLFNEQVIDVLANGDMVVEPLINVDESNIIDPALKAKIQKLKREIQKDEILKKHNDNNRKDLDTAERDLRKTAHMFLKTKYKGMSKSKVLSRLLDPKNEDHWLTYVFPGMLIKQKKIIFMTVAKFVYPYDSVLDSPFYFYEDPTFKNAVFYIDEFDQAKGSMLNQIIARDAQSSNGSINLLGLFDNIIQVVNRGLDNLPSELFVASEAERKRGYNDEALRSRFMELSSIGKKIYDDYALFYELKTKGIDAENKDFLFHDTIITAPIGKRNASHYVIKDEKDRTNYIQNKGEEDLKLEVILRRIEGYIRFFLRVCYIFAINIRETQAQKYNGFYELSDAISSFVSSLRINEPYASFICNQVLYGNMAQRKNNVENLDAGFYENGFSLITIEDDSSHSMNSIVKMEVHNDTPEKILLNMCRQGLTIGLSATGTVDTNIGNFDLDYIRTELKDRFLAIGGQDFELIAKEYEKSVNGQKGIYRVAITKEYKKDTEFECIKDIFEEFEVDDGYVNDFYEQITNQISDFSDRKHIYNLIWSFNRFLSDEEVYSFLCLMNTYLNKYSQFVKGLMSELIKLYAKKGETQYESKTIDDIFLVLESNGFDEAKRQLLDRLNKGEKVFVLSTFQALATGQNLQYSAPGTLRNGAKLVKTNGRDNPDHLKDFDGIFIEKPTNMLVNLSNISVLSDEQRVEAMYQAEELKEAGEISRNTCFNVLNHIAGGGKKYEDLYSKDSVKNAAAAIIIQGIGRIDRTNIKSKHVYIYAEYDAVTVFSPSILDSKSLRSPAVQAFMIRVRECGLLEKTDEDKKTINKACKKADELGNNIYRLMNNGSWDNNSIEKWELINENLLQDPQGVSVNKDSGLFIDLPRQATKYFYREKADFRNNEISFDNISTTDGWQEVSTHSVRLDMLMSIPEIKELFAEKGYATEFVPSARMMAPVIANNLLKGRYGEVVGKYLLEKYGGIVLEKFTDPALYEKFDFHVKQYKAVVDFKNWSEAMRFDDDKYTEKMVNKAKDCGSTLVLAVNLFSREDYKPFVQVVDGIQIIEIPNIIVKRGDTYEVNYKRLNQIGEIIREHTNESTDK